MKQKLLMMLAALMLMGTSAMAQSETLKGDVNGDGAVDVADIAAVIQIMKDNGDIKTKYYWYVGQENPASVDESNLKTATNEAGWHLIGESTDGFTMTFNNSNLIEFDEKKPYYLIIPNSLNVYAADGNTSLEDKSLLATACSIENHKAFVYYTSVYEVKGVVIK